MPLNNKCTSVEHNQTTQVEWNTDKNADVESVKTSTKVALNHGDCKTTWTMANDKFSVSADAKALDQDGWNIKVGGSYEDKPAKKEWKADVCTHVSSPDLSGAHAFLHVSC